MTSWPQRVLMLGLAAMLAATALHVSQLARASRAAVEATTATQTSTSLIGFTQRESLNSIVAIDQWLAGGSSRRDLQIARALLARRLATADEQGRTAGELAGGAYRTALNDLDAALTTAPPGVLSLEAQRQFREEVGPEVIRFSAEVKRLSDIFQQYSDQVLQETTVAVEDENRHVVISLLVTFATVVVLLFWMTRDILGRYRRAAEMEYRATHDSLTGLVNRASLLERVHAAVRRADPTASLALVFIDLDGFKQVNDELGHNAGDQILVATAARLAELVGGDPSWTAARLGGDEFVVLCEHLVDPANVERLAGELV
ncbi:MAG: diguanylate cyclase domain-containing protein, partial [Actinomycetes bacterium]